MKKFLSLFAAILFAAGMMAVPVVLPATLDVSNVSFRSEGMPDFVIEEGQDYAGTYFDMGAHDSSNDTLLYAEWDVTIEPIKYNLAVDVYNTNSWRVQLYLLNQTGDTLKSLRYKGSSGQKGQFGIGSLDLSDLEAGDYKVRVHAATAWSAMKLKDVIFAADYQGVSVALPGTLLPAYALLSEGASATASAIAFTPSTANEEFATWNVSFAKAGDFNVTIALTASNGHNYSVELLSEDGLTQIDSIGEDGQKSDTGEKELGVITVPAAGNYVVKLRNATQWSEALLNSISFAVAVDPFVIPRYEVAEAIAAGLKDSDEVEIRGVVSKMEFKGKNFAKYGSVCIYVKDATGAEGEFEFYNCFSLNADTFKVSVPEYDATSTSWAQFTEVKDSKGVALHVGDTVIGLGKYKLFNTTHELLQGCFLVDLRPFKEVHTYTVAGSSEVAFGKAWDPKNEANDMVELLDGRFAWWQTDLKLAKGEIEFKVCKDHAWTVAYPKDNYKLAIPEDGIYTIEIYFDPAADDSVKVSAKAEKTGEAVIIPSLLMHGNFTGTWKDTDPFVLSEDSLYQVLKLELAAGDYEFGMKFDGAWKANGDTITRDIPSTSLAAGSGNMHIIADVAGEYTFVYVLATQTLDVVYPKVPKPVWENPIYKTDFFNKDWSKDTLSTAKWDAENQKVIVNIIPGKSDTWQGQLWLKLPMDVRAGYEYDLSFKAKANKTFGGTVVKYQENAEMTIIYDFEMKAGEEAIYSKENLRGVNGGNGILCLSFGYAPDSTDIELYDFAIVEHEATSPVAKFYVTGNDAFTADAGLEAAQAWHPDALPSYGDTLTVALKAGAAYQLKICVDGTWNTAKNFNDLTEKAAGLIDADGDNHNIGFSLVADGDVKIIYTAEVFKLEGNFVTEAIDNTFVGEKAVKVIVNGQLLIIRDGKTFTVMGQQIQ